MRSCVHLFATCFLSGRSCLAAAGFFLSVLGFSPSANACSDLQNICEQQRAHAEEMNRMGYEAAMAAQAGADGAAAAAAAEARRPKTLQFASGAVVWYLTSAGAPGIYVTAGAASQSDAIQIAMANCYHLGGLNCRVGDAWNRGFAAVAEAEDGSLHYAFGDSKGGAGNAAKKLCASGAGCRIIATYDNQGTLFYAD